jgi:hypothetical protein
MRLYDVHYVMYGHYERKQWGSAGQQVLAAHLPLVWDSGQVQIYGQPDDLPEALVWLHPVDWGPLEYTSDHRQQLFSWLTGTSGKLSITSTRQALVEVQLSVLNSRMPGQLSIWQGEQQLALWDISPNRPIQRVLRLPVEAGTTTLELRTSVPLGEDQGRTITLALAQPTLRVLPMVEPYPVRPKMLPLALDLLK